MAVKFLFGLLTPCLDLANLNILKRKPPCFSLELIVAFAYQPQYLAIELSKYGSSGTDMAGVESGTSHSLVDTQQLFRMSHATLKRPAGITALVKKYPGKNLP